VSNTKKKRITEHIRQRGQTRRLQNTKKGNRIRGKEKDVSTAMEWGKTTCEKLKNEPNRAEKAV
jgi:hypothetical protein